jgi:hypothetical protein
MAKRTIEVDAKTKGAERGLARLKKVTDASAVAFAGLGAALAVSVKAFAEQDAANGRLSRSLKEAGADTDAFKVAQAQMLDNMRRLGVGIQDQTDALNRLVMITRDAEKASEALNLSLDIASQKNIDVAAASEKVSKVLNGEVEVLKELGVLNVEQVKQLAALEDQNERTAIAVSFLEESFLGAAEQNAGLIDEFARSEEEAKLLQVAVGDLTSALGEAGVGLVSALADVAFGSDDAASGLDRMRESVVSLATDVRSGIQDLQDFARGVASLSAGEAASLFGAGGAGSEFGFGGLANPENIRRLVARGGADQRAISTAAEEAEFAGGFNFSAAEVSQFEREQRRGQSAARLSRASAAQARRKRAASRRPAKQEKDPSLRDIIGGADRAATDDVLKGLEKEIAARNKVSEAVEKQIQMVGLLTEAQNAQVQGALDVAGAVGGLASEFIDSEAAKAGIQAAIEGARAIAAGAAGNIPGAIGHAAAAVAFGKAAAEAGKGTGGGGKGASGGGGSAQIAKVQDVEDIQKRNAKILADELGRDQAQLQRINTTVTNEFRSIAKPSLDEAQQIADATTRAMRTRA